MTDRKVLLAVACAFLVALGGPARAAGTQAQIREIDASGFPSMEM